MKKTDILTIVLIAVPTVAAAQESDSVNFLCRNGDLERRIDVVYEAANVVPCEVHYTKDMETPGEAQVLWRATQESGYCETRAREFVAKLESWGWDCLASAGAERPATPADDTDSLTPSEPENGDTAP